MVKPLMVLNDYQQIMLRIAKYAPYNAIHSVLINLAPPLSQSTLQEAILCVIHQLGIGAPHLTSSDRLVFHPLAEPPSLVIRTISLHQHINEEINHPFGFHDCPLRFFIIHSNEDVYFSITYNHWIADAYAISRLLQAILLIAQGQAAPNLTLLTPDLKDCFKHIYRYKTTFYRFSGIVQTMLKFSSAFRTLTPKTLCVDTGSLTYFFSPQILSTLIQHCKNQSITVNDLLIALLAQLFGKVTQQNRSNIKAKIFKPKRNRIVVGVISNLRGRSRLSLDAVMGVFLGFFYLSFKSPEQKSLTQLSQQVQKKTVRLKNSHADIKQFLLFKIQSFLWDKASQQESKYRLFHKNSPITVGISNMVLTNKKEELFANQVYSYLRCSPTAMVCPIVFNLTTLAGHLSLGVSYRKTCYSDQKALEIMNQFIDALQSLDAKD